MSAPDDGPLVVWGAGTPRTHRAYWALQELGVEYEPHLVGSRSDFMRSDEMARLNAKRKVPVLEDGDFVLTESAAIVSYLGDRYGRGSGLTPPAGTSARARYDEWCFFVMMELDAHTLYVVRRHRDLAELYGEAPAAVEEAFAGFHRQLDVAEQRLAEGRAHLLGDGFTGADILLGTCLDWAAFYDRPLPPALSAYLDRLRSREAYRSSFAVNYSILPDGSPRRSAGR